MRTLIALFFLLAAAGAEAACTRPAEPAPSVPDGNTADDAAMQAAHDRVQAYVNTLEAYQACLKKQAADAPADTPPELKGVWLAQGDAAIDVAEASAADFAVALKAFKAHSPQPQAKK